MDRMREERKRGQKSDIGRAVELREMKTEGDEALDGERRVWPLIRGTMGSVQSNQSRAELYSRLGLAVFSQSLRLTKYIHCPLLIDDEGRTNL